MIGYKIYEHDNTNKILWVFWDLLDMFVFISMVRFMLALNEVYSNVGNSIP